MSGSVSIQNNWWNFICFFVRRVFTVWATRPNKLFMVRRNRTENRVSSSNIAPKCEKKTKEFRISFSFWERSEQRSTNERKQSAKLVKKFSVGFGFCNVMNVVCWWLSYIIAFEMRWQKEYTNQNCAMEAKCKQSVTKRSTHHPPNVCCMCRLRVWRSFAASQDFGIALT